MRRPFALTLAVTVAGLLLALAWLPTQAQTPTPGVSLPASAPSAEHSALLQTFGQRDGPQRLAADFVQRVRADDRTR